MCRIFLVHSLALHALEQHPFYVGVSHSGDVEERVEVGKVPRLETIPHCLHCGWTERDEIRERVLEEESLMALVMVAADQARLRGRC